MPAAPTYDIDPRQFWADPYPDLARMRATTPIVRVPQLDATLLTRRDDIFECEKNVAVFSSWQPAGLMTTLMGENLMRKDGEAHLGERRQAFPSLSPRTVAGHWRERFVAYTEAILDGLAAREEIDLVRDYAMPVSANALREITGLTSMTPAEMDASSQGMIDGCANYAGDPDVEARCHEATGRIDAAIDMRLPEVGAAPDYSLLSILTRAGQPLDAVRANIKLTISGGQNEPRDAIAGLVWALLTHPEQLEKVLAGEVSWLAAFEEYARWISPIGMSPRRVARDYSYHDVDFAAESRVFLMFGSANRDESVFDEPARFDVTRDTSKAVAFGAGPHFCAGAAASRCLIGEVAMPLLFERFPDIRLAGEVPFGGWAFRGPLAMPVRLA
ncbi:MAG: cytochrome P450 [Gammaproteobacteria bacterium]